MNFFKKCFNMKKNQLNKSVMFESSRSYNNTDSVPVLAFTAGTKYSQYQYLSSIGMFKY